jgi:cysteine-S-conjugate beta-lyase
MISSRRRTSEKWTRYPQDVLPVFVAEMDFELAPAIKAALHDAIERSDCGYAHPKGLSEAFCDYAAAKYGWNVAPERVFAVADVMGGVAETLRLFTAHGDGVVVNPPIYPPFFEVIRTNARRVVEVPLLRSDDDTWSLDWEGLERAFAEGAKAFLFCHPHNPTGRVFDQSELERIAELCARYDVLLISDEIHAPLTYDSTHIPSAPIAERHHVRSVTLMSASKAWNIPGLKCAQLIAASAPMQLALTRLPHEVTYRIGILGIIATIAAYREGEEWLLGVMKQLDANRHLLRTLLQDQIPAIRYRVPDATYLAWLDCERLALKGDPARIFLDRGRVALASGSHFGAGGRSFVRLNFATDEDTLREAVSRMARTIA